MAALRRDEPQLIRRRLRSTSAGARLELLRNDS
jgi:hypothetical protein